MCFINLFFNEFYELPDNPNNSTNPENPINTNDTKRFNYVSSLNTLVTATSFN